ncbi:hypothetical protein SAMN05660469_0682 [Fructobacillus pseudoficulneus]|nr:hypothetical protein SAMN05660469_0682 [Fructobacillus pseudoficulneus]
MTWFFWPAIWLMVMLIIVMWRFFYRTFPKLNVLDLSLLPTFVLVYQTWGSVFYRSDLLAVILLLLLIGAVWGFVVVRNGQKVLRFFHHYLRFCSLIGDFLMIILVVMSIILKK